MIVGPGAAQHLATVDPVLGGFFLEVCQHFGEQFPGCRLSVAQGYRTPGNQQIANAEGRSKANGRDTFSYHQHLPSLAIDFAVLDPTVDGYYVEDGQDARYLWVGRRFEELGCVWGGSWKDPDWDHVNLVAPAPDRDSAAAAYQAWLELAAAAPFLRAA